MGFTPAVQLSFLKKKEQKEMLDVMEFAQCTPSYQQTLSGWISPNCAKRVCWRKEYQMKIQLIDFGGRSPRELMPMMPVRMYSVPKDAVIRPGDICKAAFGIWMPVLIPDFTFENWKERGTGLFGSTGR